ncbi:MAG: tRNA (adenosine(37)-N6)-threonylcarbamoyltransferase complex dimerization subunit type 1 TsaB [Anaerolineales bacterium]|nr:tRNA (adenosine(37)-N6)-threonylcarbamoyltransferase complex dimerization subunit type 1 TsaB [Anaerolineales bacterium]
MLLAIDTATSKIGIALFDGISVLHEAVWQSPYRHTTELAPAIDACLVRAECSIEDLKAVGLAIGPGSYTGLRIGVAVAKGMALARSLDLIAVSTFEILAAAFTPRPDLQLVAVLEAGRGRFSVGWYQAAKDEWHASSPPELHTPETLSKAIRTPTLVCGELDDSLRKILGRKHKNVILASPSANLRRPALLAELAWARWQAGETDDPETLAPVYLQTTQNIPG